MLVCANLIHPSYILWTAFVKDFTLIPNPGAKVKNIVVAYWCSANPKWARRARPGGHLRGSYFRKITTSPSQISNLITPELHNTARDMGRRRIFRFSADACAGFSKFGKLALSPTSEVRTRPRFPYVHVCGCDRRQAHPQGTFYFDFHTLSFILKPIGTLISLQ